MTTSDLLRRSQEIYDHRLKQNLERTDFHAFVAIEPQSGDYFLGRTLSEAAAAAAAAHPNRRSCVLRVGHDTTITIGAGMS
ncbi:MAG: hypothetical protein HYX68_22920 [Planctomycetes bacterium]|nr:hypothetical protein [Planctomycetota bacterium]